MAEVRDWSSWGTRSNFSSPWQITLSLTSGSSVVVINSEGRLARRPTSESADHDIPWQKHMFALHFSSLRILIRSGFRVAEYIQGLDGFLLQSEVFMYVYDGLLILFVAVVFLAIHPSELSCILRRGWLLLNQGNWESVSLFCLFDALDRLPILNKHLSRKQVVIEGHATRVPDMLEMRKRISWYWLSKYWEGEAKLN